MSLLEIHAVAHIQDDLPCLQHGWSEGVSRLSTAGRDLKLLLVASESWLEWQDIMRRVLQRTPAEWRSAPRSDLKALQHDVGELWSQFTKGFNASSSTIHEAIVVAEGVTEPSRELGLSFTTAPKYQWAAQEMSCHLKYSVRKLLAKERYRKATKRQLKAGEARRGFEAAKGVLPVTWVACV